MRKNVYYCDRCGCQLEDSGTKIVPHYFDFITEDLTVPINKDMENRHYCIDCTMEALEFLEPKRSQKRSWKKMYRKNLWIPEKSWHCITRDGIMPRLRMSWV